MPPNQEYIAALDNVNAGFSADNAEYRMSEAEFNAAVARDPAAAQLAEQLSKSFYAGDITQEEYSGAMDLMKAQLLPTVESLPTVGPESSVGAARKGFDPYSALQGSMELLILVKIQPELWISQSRPRTTTMYPSLFGL